MVGRYWCIIAHNMQEERHDRCQKMRDKCDSGKWSEGEMQDKSLGKHEYASRGNCEALLVSFTHLDQSRNF